MAEYRIVARIDPQTSAGAAKVKQDLQSIEAAAARPIRNVNDLKAAMADLHRQLSSGAINQQTYKREMDALAKSAEGLRRPVEGAGQAIDRMVASAQRASPGLRGTGLEASRAAEMFRKGSVSIADLTGRVTEATPRLDSLASSAQNAGGAIGGGGAGGVAGRGLSTAVSVAAGVVGGLFATAIATGVTMLVDMAIKALTAKDAVDELVDKMREDAEKAELSRQAHERWNKTLDALIERQGRLADAMRDRLKVQGLADQSDLAQAQRDQRTLQGEIQKEQNRLAELRRQLQEANVPIALTGGRGDEARLGQQAARVARLRSEIEKVEGEITRLTGAANDAQTRITAGQILVGEQQGKALVDLSARASAFGDNYLNALRLIQQGNAEVRAQAPQVAAGWELVRAAMDRAASAGVNFDRTGDRAVQLARDLNHGKISVAGYRAEMAKLATGLNAAAEAAEKAGKKVSDGVARFTSAKQAIGIAGRELRAAGLKVGENEQFGGTTPGAHRGAGHREERAIDVDIAGASDKFPTPPDIAARYDAVARRYAARGYIVLWAGKRYDPSGRVTAITSGDMHYGHMHVEAPTAIVGRATQAGSEAEIARAEREELSEAQKAANLAREKGDFVGSIIDQQSLRGLESGPESLQARMDKIVGDYKRRFNTDTMPAEDQKKIRDALLGGDQREIAKHFEDTYVKPLQRLEALRGKTGLDRTVVNAQLDEELRLKRELTPVEAQMIENGIRRGDQLAREAQLLEQIRGPMEDYRRMIETLNALLARGEISQAAYNARLAEMANSATQSALSGLKGVAPDGRAFEDIAAVSDENARYAAQLQAIDEFRQKKIDIGVTYDQLELAAAQQHAANLAAIDQARRDVTLQSYEQMAGSMTGIMKDMFGEQSRAYKAMFAIEKAVAIARAIVAIQTGIAQASALPFPANLPAIASVIAATASIVSNIQAVALNFRDGGLPAGRVRGPGGPRSDSIPANVSRDEFIVNADATRRNLSLLEAINSGRDVRQMGRARAAETARVVAANAPPVNVTAPPAAVEVVVVDDPRKALMALKTAEGKKAVVELLESDPTTFRRLLGST